MGTTLLNSLDVSSKEKLIHELKDFYIPYRTSLKLPSYATFGLEIEFRMNGYDDSYKLNFIDQNNAATSFLKEQGYDYNYKVEDEVNDHIELISPVLTDSKATWDELKNILEFIKNNNGNISYENGIYELPSCGSHIHVGKNMFNDNPNAWLDFFKLWYLYEDIIFKFTNGEYYKLRPSAKNKASKINNICMKILNDYSFFNQIDISYLINNKINCINFNQANITQRIINPFENNKANTIEFRNPNGTLNKVIWQNNVNFLTKILFSISSANFDVEKLNYLFLTRSEINEFSLCDLIFNEDFDKYCFLKQYYKDFDVSNNIQFMFKSKPFWK